MTKPASQDALEGVGTIAAAIATPLVVATALVAALADKAWWVVLLVGWVAQVLAGFAAAGVGILLGPISRRASEKFNTALMAVAVLVALAAWVAAMVFVWMNWA